jgi:outer membrane lipoprotein-sorting protein
VPAPVPASPPAPASAEPTWYAQALARGNAGLNVTHFWSKGPKLRAETVVAGHKVVTLVNGKWYYAYDALGRQGIALVRTPDALARDAPERRPFGNEAEALQHQGGQRVSEEIILGIPCDVYRLTDALGRREVWVMRGGSALPVRLSIFDRVRGTTMTTDFLNWQSGLPIDDAFFEPDPGIELQRLTIEEYFLRWGEKGPIGPVPILYADLLHGNVRKSGR